VRDSAATVAETKAWVSLPGLVTSPYSMTLVRARAGDACGAVGLKCDLRVVWSYQRLAYVISRSIPTREQSPNTSISLDQNAVSGGISSLIISQTCQCH
jgi:hypothetical protein